MGEIDGLYLPIMPRGIRNQHWSLYEDGCEIVLAVIVVVVGWPIPQGRSQHMKSERLTFADTRDDTTVHKDDLHLDD